MIWGERGFRWNFRNGERNNRNDIVGRIERIWIMKRDIALAGMVFAAVMAFFTINHFVGDGTLSG